MLQRLQLVALLAASVCLPGALGAQTLPEARISAGRPQTIILPRVLVAGERATLAVLDARGTLVPAVDVDLSSGRKITTDATGRAAFTAPLQTGVFTATITETGAKFTATVLALSKDSRDPYVARKPASSSRLAYPEVIVLGDRFDVFAPGDSGTSGFSGDANLDRVAVGNLPALVLAASPVSLVALPNPHTNVGLADLIAGMISRKPDPQRVTVVSLRVSGPATSLAAGEKSALLVRVDGSGERLLVDVRNATPEIVDFPRGNVEHLVTSGGPANVATVTLVGLKPGDYSVSARLPAAVGPPAIAAARLQLLAAWQAAAADWRRRMDRLIREMDRDREYSPRDVYRFKNEVERLMRDHPPDPVGELLRLAWESLDAG